jgi:WhiB family redox-sensing transcriptional regulator
MGAGDPGIDLLLEALRARTAWMASAACRGSTVDFFPAAPARGVAPDVASALAVCAGCPVTARCREFAEENGEYGIWGSSRCLSHIRRGRA